MITLKTYPFFHYAARCSFLKTLVMSAVALSSSGCSSNHMPTTVPLESLDLTAKNCTLVKSSPSSQVVYRCIAGDDAVFVMPMKDCSIPEKLTFQTTTRQLFVGVLGMKIITQGVVLYGALNALQTVITGTLDAQPIMMSTFTFRRKNCVNDIIVWQGLDSVNDLKDRVLAFAKSSRQLTASLFNENITVPDVSRVED